MISKKPIIIKTKDFTLRPLRISDAPAISKNVNDRKIARNLLSIPYPYTIKDAHDWLKRVRNRTRRKIRSDYDFGIEINGEIAGAISFLQVQDYKAEIGYWLGRKYWGQGIMTQVVKEITKFGFNQLKLRRIYAHTFTYNKASMRVLEKAGYKFEGILRKNMKKDGNLMDVTLFAKVK